MKKEISTQVITNILDFIKKSDYYNKIQITFNKDKSSFTTETFYFFERKWGNSILKEKENKRLEVIQDTTVLENDEKITNRLKSLEADASVIIASNSGEYTLSIKI